MKGRLIAFIYTHKSIIGELQRDNSRISHYITTLSWRLIVVPSVTVPIDGQEQFWQVAEDISYTETRVIYNSLYFSSSHSINWWIEFWKIKMKVTNFVHSYCQPKVISVSSELDYIEPKYGTLDESNSLTFQNWRHLGPTKNEITIDLLNWKIVIHEDLN